MGDSRCVRCAVRTLHPREKAEIFVYLAFVRSQESGVRTKIHCISNVLTIINVRRPGRDCYTIEVVRDYGHIFGSDIC